MDPSSIESLDAVTTLLGPKSRANSNIRDRHGRTPLHIAVSREGIDVDIQRQLLDAGCDPNAEDLKGKTPLHLACNSASPGSLAAVRELLQRGSKPIIQDSVNHFTPLNNLVHESLPRCPWDCEGKIGALVAAGADINIADKCGCPPVLNAAAIPWDATLLEIILRIKGLQLDVRDTFGRGLLHYAAAYGDMGQIQVLRQHQRGFPSSVVFLDTKANDRYRHTPLSLMEWRARTLTRKLWANMRRPTADEIDSFRAFLVTIEEVREDAHHGRIRERSHEANRMEGEEEADVEMTEIASAEDEDVEEMFVDALEHQ
ncbi:hypothetical protein OQA88_9344 [Cercophora sp. LCS_1]